ncbi:MAG: hypothetical protein ACR2KH_03420 [Sphingomicrobium sp.]
MLSTILLATQVSVASPPAVAPDAGPIVTMSTIEPAHICESDGSAGIIVQGGKTAGSGIIVQGGLQPSAPGAPAATDKCKKPKL